MNKLINEEIVKFNESINDIYEELNKSELEKMESKFYYLRGYIKGFLKIIKCYIDNIDSFNKE